MYITDDVKFLLMIEIKKILIKIKKEQFWQCIFLGEIHI